MFIVNPGQWTSQLLKWRVFLKCIHIIFQIEVSWNGGTPKSSNVGRWLVFWALIATNFPKIIQHPLIAKLGRICNKSFLGCDFFSELFIC